MNVRSLIDGNGAGDNEVKWAVIDVLKERKDRSLGNLRSMKDFLVLYFLSTLYVDGAYLGVDWWTTYPGHNPGAGNPVFDAAIDRIAKLFRDQYKQDLLVRHTGAPDSAGARKAGKPLTFETQINSVSVNRNYAANVAGKRILVVDDFCTGGSSFECARNLLLHAGAAAVNLVCIGKYGKDFTVRAPRPKLEWDSYSTNSFKLSDFPGVTREGQINDEALSLFLETLAPFREGTG